jgi:dipeptidyl aminopeptidase/acylaminoacyl peptidase
VRIARLSLTLAAAVLLVPAVPAVPAEAQRPSDRLELADYLDWEGVQSPVLSPDGSQIVFTRRWIDKLNDRWESSLWIMDADGSRPRFLVNGSNPVWSPDGRRIAYLADGEPRGRQVWVRWMDAEGAATQITRLTESPSNVTWSPDGQTLAFRMLVPQRNGWNAESRVSAMRPRGATWTETPRVVERLVYRRDGQGFMADGNFHLFTVRADGGTPRQVTDGPYDHGPFEYTPDGRYLVFSSAPRVEDAEYQWRESDIFKVDIGTGQVIQLTTRSGPDSNPTVSPDGRWIAYTGYDMTDDTYRDQDLYVMAVDGTGHRRLSDAFERSPSSLRWAPDNSGIYFVAQNEGSAQLYFAPLRGGEIRQITEGTHVFGLSDIHRSGLVVGTLTSPHEPGDVVSFDLRNPRQIRQLTAVNADVLEGKRLGEVSEIWYTSSDGLRVQGWYITPPDFDPNRRYPMMLVIHGGPHSMYSVGFNFGWQEHASNDYVVLYTNPRGSTGYGSAFGNAIKNAYPGMDYDDLMAGVDTMIAKGFIDSDNMFVYGCSGGGVLTSWIVGQTDRFAAASANCPVTNWLSFVGTTDGATWYRNFASYPWDDPSEHLRRSPLMYVGNVKTPTMLMTGINDLRTPMAQTEEYYQALKVLKVPTAMVRFNDEWHGTSSKPSNFLRTQLYLRDWFEKHARSPQRTTTDSN